MVNKLSREVTVAQSYKESPSLIRRDLKSTVLVHKNQIAIAKNLVK